MKLFWQLARGSSSERDGATTAGEDAALTLEEIRREAHENLLSHLEYGGVESLSGSVNLQALLEQGIAGVENDFRLQVPAGSREQIISELTDEISGLGPLQVLTRDPCVSDILVNAPDDVWVERNGRLLKTSISFDNEAHLRRLLDRLVAQVGKQLDASSPAIDARLSDGSRLHAIVPPLSRSGAVVSIRRFKPDVITAQSLIQGGSLSKRLFKYLAQNVIARKNIVIAGGAGAGKTTLLNVLASCIPDDQRIITVEETAELNFRHGHTVSLETRTMNVEGRGEFRLRDLLKNALRMRADRIIVGEVRGEEVLDMLQAMNVGHDGSLTTVHANSADDVLLRLETLSLLNNTTVPRSAIVNMICAAVDLIVFLKREPDGGRVVATVAKLYINDGKPSLDVLYSNHRVKSDGAAEIDIDLAFQPKTTAQSESDTQ